ncbi:ovate family protein [Salix suchowensis]|nr:ovate family protein [Salix suchowensis]
MGNYRFRLSDMIPNAWFYKLKDMSKGRKQYTSQAFKKKPPRGDVTSQKSNISHQRYSYYFTTKPGRAEKFHYNSPVNQKASDTPFPDPPRKSSNKRNKRKTIYKPSPKLASTFSAIVAIYDELDFLSESDEDDGFLVPDSIENQGVPRILTKPAKFNDKAAEVTQFRRSSSKLEGVKAYRSLSVKIVKGKSMRTHKEQKMNPPARKSSANSTGIKLRANTPRIASRKIQACARKGVSFSRNKTLSESFAVVMSSVDPQRDFKDSMMEMIVENNIRDSRTWKTFLPVTFHSIQKNIIISLSRHLSKSGLT